MSDMFETNDLIRTFNSFRQADAAEETARRLAQMSIDPELSDSAAEADMELRIACLYENVVQLCKKLRLSCVWACDYCGRDHSAATPVPDAVRRARRRPVPCVGGGLIKASFSMRQALCSNP